MTVNCTVTYSATKNYLTLPENDCRFLVSEEMQKGYHINDFVNKLTTPYLPFFETANDNVGLELRCCNYAYNNMMQRYWAGNDDDALRYYDLHISAEDLINNPNKLTIAKFNYASQEVVSTEVIQLASPILYIIGQAAGGVGGRGYSNHPPVGWDSVYAGGAGGSGAAFIIAINVIPTFQTYSKIAIEASSMDGLKVYFKTNDDDYSNYIKATNGGWGNDADYTTDPRGGGSKGTYTITNSLKNKDYIRIYGTNGTPGTSGVGGTNQNAPNNVYRQASGNTSRETPFHITDNYIMYNIYPYSNTGILLQEDSTGLGEPVPYISNPNKENMLAGGPGGAPSPLFPGKSHPNNTNISETNWPGAGGCGQSGWYNMNKPDLQECNKGGPAAVWLFYVATDSECDVNNYDHKYEEKSIIIDSTCVSEGIREVVCARCGKTEIQTIPTRSHTWDNGTLIEAPTCTSEGSELYTCTVCHEGTKIETINALGHSFYKDANYINGYYYYQKCHNCDYEEELGYQIYINGEESDNYIKEGEACILTFGTLIPEVPPKDVTV